MKKKHKTTFLIGLSCASLVSSIGFATWIVQPQDTYDKINNLTQDKPIAYIDGEESVKYTTIEKALEVANKTATASSQKTVIVIPTVSEDYLTPAYVISRACEIAENVTLVITYDESVKSGDKTSAGIKSSNNFADAKDKYKTNMKSNIGLNTLLTIRGSLVICGKLGSQSQKPSGHTSADYAQLSVFDNAKITCKGTGTINCYGYIKEWYLNNNHEKKALTDSNGSLITFEDSSSVEMPGVIYDFCGGTFSSEATSTATAFPFTSFDFPNIQVMMSFDYGTSINACSQVYAGNRVNSFDMNVVGPNDNYLFVMGENSNISFKYNSISSNFSSLYGTDTDKTKWNTMNFYINKGSVNVNAIEVNKISSNSYFLPINFKYQIEVKNSTTLNFVNKAKFLNGSLLLVDEGGTVNFNSEVLFYQTYNVIGTNRFTSSSDTETVVTTTSQLYPYPSNENVKSMFNTEMSTARLINNGTININSKFGGFITPGVEGAKVVTGSNFVDNTSDNAVIFDSNKDHRYLSYLTITGYANSFINVATEQKKFVKNEEYNSNGEYWIGNAGENISDSNVAENSGALQHGSCILPTSLILMADGTYKQAGLIEVGDMVMIFNHEKGQIESAPILFNFTYEEKTVEVLDLNFDGEIIKISGDHGFFDLNLNKYVYINTNNVSDYVGHTFVSVNNNKLTYKTLQKFSIKKQLTKLYCPVSVFHLNYFVGSMLSMPGGIDGCFNIFEYDNTLKYDSVKMQSDIKEYGLMTYEECQDFIPRNIFDSLPMKYMRVAIGKGILTKEQLEFYMQHFYSLMK